MEYGPRDKEKDTDNTGDAGPGSHEIGDLQDQADKIKEEEKE